MTREEIYVRVPLKSRGPFGCDGIDDELTYCQIESLVSEAVAAERERCAKLLEAEADDLEPLCLEHSPENRLRDMADRIREGTAK